MCAPGLPGHSQEAPPFKTPNPTQLSPSGVTLTCLPGNVPFTGSRDQGVARGWGPAAGSTAQGVPKGSGAILGLTSSRNTNNTDALKASLANTQ